MSYAHVEFVLPGPARTRKEPRWGRNGPFPDPQTAIDHEAWRSVWRKASAGLKITGPVVIEVYVRLYRPPSHTKKTGGLNTAGLKHRYPPSFDCSNVLKLVEDALKNYAFEDDSMVVAAHVMKRYVPPDGGFEEGTYVSIRAVAGDI